MPVPSQGHCGFPSFPVVDWFFLFVDLWVLPFPLEDCSVFGNFVITLIFFPILQKHIIKWFFNLLTTTKVIPETHGAHYIRYLRLYATCISYKMNQRKLPQQGLSVIKHSFTSGDNDNYCTWFVPHNQPTVLKMTYASRLAVLTDFLIASLFCSKVISKWFFNPLTTIKVIPETYCAN